MGGAGTCGVTAAGRRIDSVTVLDNPTTAKEPPS